MTSGGLAACMILGQRAVGSLLGLVSTLARRGVAAAAYRELDRVLRKAGDAGTAVVTADPEERSAEPLGLEISRSGVRISVAPGEIVAVEGDDRREELRLFGEIGDALLENSAGSGRENVGVHLVDRHGSAIVPVAGEVSVVPPLPPVFRGTILDNLTALDDRRAETAIALADSLGLAAMVGRLPDGFQTRIGTELAVPLSDGAIKRVGLVRGLAGRPRLVILGRPSVALDKDGLDRLARVLEEVASETTVMAFTREEPLKAMARVVSLAIPSAKTSESA